MPELPEVESTVRYLSSRVLGHKICGVEVRWSRTVQSPGTEEFKKTLLGARILQVSRRGKYIRIELQSVARKTYFLFSHLRMTGSFDVVKAEAVGSAHDRVVFALNNGTEVRFSDTRKFGRFMLSSDPEACTKKLGPEPLDSAFTAAVLASALKSRKGRIKSVLLNQSVVAGLGNIYVDECLWRAKIHPLTPAHKISQPRIVDLHKSIRHVLEEAISNAGTDFGDGVVDYGMYQPKVYGRTKQTCHRCKAEIKRIIVGQRSTHYCPQCQKR